MKSSAGYLVSQDAPTVDKSHSTQSGQARYPVVQFYPLSPPSSITSTSTILLNEFFPPVYCSLAYVLVSHWSI